MGAPDEFHEDAHPKAREITGDRQYGEWGQCISSRNKVDERCKGYALGSHGKCNNHGGSTPSKDENPDVGAPEGNDNAVDHGAYRENFLEHLTDDEQQLVEDLAVGLGTKEDAQEVARFAASICLAQFRRSGFDERFARRFESICDKAGIFPADELDVNHDGVQVAFMENLRNYHESDDDEEW